MQNNENMTNSENTIQSENMTNSENTTQSENKKTKTNKVLDIVKAVLVYGFMAFSVIIMIFTIISVKTFDNDKASLFGHKLFVVKTDSMKKGYFDAGDVILVKIVKDVREINVGDVITFNSSDPDKYGEVITHKVRDIVVEDGTRKFVTYGTTTGVDDEYKAEIIIGKYSGKIPNLGAFFLFLKTTPGYIVCILVPFSVVLILQGINCVRLFKQYRKEQTLALEEEREQLRKEREQTQKMLEELEKLKEQMSKKE